MSNPLAYRRVHVSSYNGKESAIDEMDDNDSYYDRGEGKETNLGENVLSEYEYTSVASEGTAKASVPYDRANAEKTIFGGTTAPPVPWSEEDSAPKHESYPLSHQYRKIVDMVSPKPFASLDVVYYEHDHPISSDDVPKPFSIGPKPSLRNVHHPTIVAIP